MTRFVTLDAVMNYLTETIKSEISPIQIKSWAYNFYRSNSIEESLEKKIIKLPITNNTVILPDNVVKINGVYSDTATYVPTETTLEDLTIQQNIFYQNVGKSYYPMYYIGQNSKCILEYICNECQYNFSLNNTMTELTTNYTGTHIYLSYEAHVEEDGEIKIPDDTYLLTALASYVEYMFWRNNLHRHENNSINIMNHSLQQANLNIKAYRSKKLMRSLKKGRLITSVTNRFKYEIDK